MKGRGLPVVPTMMLPCDYLKQPDLGQHYDKIEVKVSVTYRVLFWRMNVLFLELKR
jgi:hypothetical protein